MIPISRIGYMPATHHGCGLYTTSDDMIVATGRTYKQSTSLAWITPLPCKDIPKKQVWLKVKMLDINHISPVHYTNRVIIGDAFEVIGHISTLEYFLLRIKKFFVEIE